MVESQPSKLLVAGSIPVSRSKIFRGGLAPLGLPLRRRSLGLGASLRSAGRVASLAPSQVRGSGVRRRSKVSAAEKFTKLDANERSE